MYKWHVRWEWPEDEWAQRGFEGEEPQIRTTRTRTPPAREERQEAESVWYRGGRGALEGGVREERQERRCEAGTEYNRWTVVNR